MSDIFERDRSGEVISPNDPDYCEIDAQFIKARLILSKLNSAYHTDAEIREIFSELTEREVDKTTCICLPFYSDFGKNIQLGKNVFINVACTFLDRGGIILEDKVLLGPNVKILTTNHDLNPPDRRSTISKPVRVCENAWIGAGAIILPGVTIGKNAVVAAGSVVIKDVPDNTIVAGNPAKNIKQITEEKAPQ